MSKHFLFSASFWCLLSFLFDWPFWWEWGDAAWCIWFAFPLYLSWVFFYIPVDHLYLVFWEVPLWIFAHALICFLAIDLTSLYFLDRTPLLDAQLIICFFAFHICSFFSVEILFRCARIFVADLLLGFKRSPMMISYFSPNQLSCLGLRVR